MTKKHKYLIVGQGLAGTSIAFAMIQRGLDFKIIDPNKAQTASKAAGGLFNPITGRVRKLTWKANELFPFLHTWYPEMERYLGERFFYSKPLYYPFFNVLEQNEWSQKSRDEPYNAFIEEISGESKLDQHWKEAFGGMTVKKSGHVDLKTMLSAFRRRLQVAGHLIEGTFKEGDWSWKDGIWGNPEYEFERIIHCGGMEDHSFTYWNFLPLRPLKGEILKVKIPLPDELIINRGVFINSPPDNSGTVIVGSSYQRGETSWTPTETARDLIREKLEKLYVGPYEIVDQWAGIRPTSKDRRPLIGAHPELPEMYVFNGMGTKGVSLSPYFADHFVSVLEEGEELEDEVNISRYYSLYWS